MASPLYNMPQDLSIFTHSRSKFDKFFLSSFFDKKSESRRSRRRKRRVGGGKEEVSVVFVVGTAPVISRIVMNLSQELSEECFHWVRT